MSFLPFLAPSTDRFLPRALLPLTLCLVAASMGCLVKAADVPFDLSDLFASAETMLAVAGKDGEIKQIWAVMDASSMRTTPLFLETSLRVEIKRGDTWTDLGALKLEKKGGFEICGPDSQFIEANATIDGTHVLVESASVPAPTAVRYAWKNFALANLFDDQGYPAAPFRTDNQPPPSK
jgi:hypothetical protein